METFCQQYHLSPSLAAALTPLLVAGDDAREVKWLLARSSEPDFQSLYGSHRAILLRAVELHRLRLQANQTTAENARADRD